MSVLSLISQLLPQNKMIINGEGSLGKKIELLNISTRCSSPLQAIKPSCEISIYSYAKACVCSPFLILIVDISKVSDLASEVVTNRTNVLPRFLYSSSLIETG